MSVEIITWLGLCEMYAQYIDSDMPPEAINPYIEAFAQAMHVGFVDVLDGLLEWYLAN